MAYGLSFPVMFVAWLIVLVAGRMPRPLHEALAAAVRYHIRVTGYFLMLTARYPGGLFGDPATSAFVAAPADGLSRRDRLARRCGGPGLGGACSRPARAGPARAGPARAGPTRPGPA